MIQRVRWSPLRQKIEEILADGEWHTVRELYLAVDDLITPETAIRSFSTRDRTTTFHDYDDRIMIGKRRIIHNTLRRGGRFETAGEGWGYRWRKIS